jgi:hypothetical protein
MPLLFLRRTIMTLEKTVQYIHYHSVTNKPANISANKTRIIKGIVFDVSHY